MIYHCFFKRILDLEETLIQSVAEIKEDLSELLRRCNTNIAELKEEAALPLSLPLNNKEELSQFCNWSKEKENSQILAWKQYVKLSSLIICN